MENREPDLKKNIPLSKKIASCAILLLAVCIFGAVAFFSIRYFGLRPVIYWEYGDGIPDVSVFSKNGNASYADAPSSKLEKGWHRIVLRVSGGQRIVWMNVRDTKAPSAQPVERTISTLDTLQPDQMISSLGDADLVKVMFETPPPFGEVGDYDVRVILEDASGNRSVVTSRMHIRVVSEQTVTVEAGSEAPPFRSFLMDDYVPEKITEITEQMLHTPGQYPIEFTIDGTVYTASLTVVDTVAPRVQSRTLFSEPEKRLRPEDFLSEVADESETKAEFLTFPDYDERNFQSVSIRVTDAGGNYSDVTAGLLLTHAQPIVIEARTTFLTPEDCLKDYAYENAVMIKQFIPDTIGMYAVSVQVDGKAELALVEVRDTVPPVVTGGNVSGYLHHPVAPEELCSIIDATQTTAVFEKEPDWTTTKPQDVTIIVTDSAGNQGGTTVHLTLVHDKEPPVLYGIKTRYFYIDEPIQYLEGVAALDNADGMVPVTVDASKVNPHAVGRYQVVYSAVDAAGNRTSQEVEILIKKSKVKADRLDGYVREIMAEITNDDMTLADKVFAIYDYVFTHVRYASRSDKTDWRREALRGIQRGRGDCYTSNSLARALLETTEAEIFIVQRHSYNTHHYWLLVNIGTGWYHFDATNSREHGYKCCMWTDSQCSVMRRFWVYEESAAPPVAKERFDRDKAAAVEADWVAQHQTGNTIDPYDDEVLGEKTEGEAMEPEDTEEELDENDP